MEAQGQQGGASEGGARPEQWWQKEARENREPQEAEKEKRRCPYVMVSGKRCLGRPQEGHKYCWNHEQYRRRCYMGDFFVPLLEDEATIRLTISHALQAMMNGHLKPMIARTVISGCGTALSALRSERWEQRRQLQDLGQEGPSAPDTGEEGDDEVVLGESGIPRLKDEPDRTKDLPRPEDSEEIERVQPPEPVLMDAEYETREEPHQRPHKVGFEPEVAEDIPAIPTERMTREQIQDVYYGRVTAEEAVAKPGDR
jgi:hypothetical protein